MFVHFADVNRGGDPYLMATMATSFVRGLQGDHPRYLKVAATALGYLSEEEFTATVRPEKMVRPHE